MPELKHCKNMLTFSVQPADSHALNLLATCLIHASKK